MYMKRLIFTDLDGTFLNHHNYSFEESFEALQKIKEAGIPLIFTTSKTKAEVEYLQAKVGISEPFIVENGAALFIPDGYKGFDLSSLKHDDHLKVMVFGESYTKVLEFYRSHKDTFNIVGMSDMTDAEIGHLTGLSQRDVLLAKQRDFTEPFILKDETKLKALKKSAQRHGLKIIQGGRFYHIMSESQDKGIAVIKTIELFETLYQERVRSIALGDSQNDTAMLEQVDIPIVIQKYDGSYLETDVPHIQKSSYQGSKGWNEMVMKNV